MLATVLAQNDEGNQVSITTNNVTFLDGSKIWPGYKVIRIDPVRKNVVVLEHGVMASIDFPHRKPW